jgi:hypothetical protein
VLSPTGFLYQNIFKEDRSPPLLWKKKNKTLNFIFLVMNFISYSAHNTWEKLQKLVREQVPSFQHQNWLMLFLKSPLVGIKDVSGD